jgi:hypothetical protein
MEAITKARLFALLGFSLLYAGSYTLTQAWVWVVFMTLSFLTFTVSDAWYKEAKRQLVN